MNVLLVIITVTQLLRVVIHHVIPSRVRATADMKAMVSRALVCHTLFCFNIVHVNLTKTYMWVKGFLEILASIYGLDYS